MAFRVSMVSSGIPAYQNDFNDIEDAKAAALRLANGAKAEFIESGYIAMYKGKRSTVIVSITA